MAMFPASMFEANQPPSYSAQSAFSGPAKSSTSLATTANPKPDTTNNCVWLIFHKSGRQHAADLIGVYTTEKRALKNAKALIDAETGGAANRVKNGVVFVDNSAKINQLGDEGIIYEAKFENGGRNVVNFTKAQLNEDIDFVNEAARGPCPDCGRVMRLDNLARHAREACTSGW